MDKLIKGKYFSVDKVWRKSPTKQEECKIYENTGILEDFDINSTSENIFPLVSKRALEKHNFEESSNIIAEIFGAEINEAKSFSSIFSQSDK